MATIRPIRKSSRSRVFWIGEADRVKNLYKYMDMERAFDFLRSGTLYFVEPTIWKDPYEKRFYNADYSNLGYARPKVFCACFTYRADSEAAWRMYCGDSGIASRSMRLRLSKKGILDRLDKFARDNNCTVYAGNVDYSFDRYVIDTLHRRESPQYDAFFAGFDLEKFLNLLLIKRKDFEYENEIRIFIVPEHAAAIGQPGKSNDDLLCPVIIPNHTEHMEAPVIDPNCTDLEIEMITKLSDELLAGKDKRCKRSGLYAPQETIIIE